jgi:hypothetical protein
MRGKPVCLALTTVLVYVLGVPTVQATGLVSPGGLQGEYFNSTWRYGTPALTRIDPGIDVALQDAGGKMAVVVHPDPEVLIFADWTQWKIPLSRLAAAGVDPKSIKRMYIGVGDRNNPQPNGFGRIWIDDIRVIRSASP